MAILTANSPSRSFFSQHERSFCAALLPQSQFATFSRSVGLFPRFFAALQPNLPMPPPSLQSIPWYRRFRTHLIIALFPILAAVTGASLWVAERRFSAVYQGVFEAQFQSYIDAFDRSRAQRFEAIGNKLEEIAATPALIGHLKEGKNKSLKSLLEPLLLDLGRQRLSSESALPFATRRRLPFSPGQSQDARERPLPDRGPPPPGLRNAPPSEPLKTLPRDGAPAFNGEIPPLFFALLDPTGKTIPETSFPNRLNAPDRNRHTHSFLNLRSRSLSEVLPHQEVGYLLIDIPGEERNQVREIFVTPARDADGTFLGALVFGLPLPTLDERVLFQQTTRMEQGQILSGIWIEGQIVSATIPDAKQSELAHLISQALETDNHASGDLTLSVDDRRYRVIYRILNPDSPFERAVQINLYSLAAVDEEIAAIRILSAEIAGLAMLVSLGLIILVSRNLSGPVSTLTTATHQIASGNYEFRVPVKARDEVGLLSAAFNEMAADLALHDRYRSVLSAVADPAVAQRLIHDSHDLGGVQKVVSILFCDIRGFTSISERLPAPAVIELINEHMTALTRVAYEYGGTVDKFVGDLIMVLFGAPESAPDDAERAVRCAIAMRETRTQLNASSATPLEIGLGIATGSVIAGCMGSQQRLNYTVLGHRVNLAARLCGIAAAGQILIDDTTRQSLPLESVIDPLPLARLKGIADEVQVYAVLSLPVPPATARVNASAVSPDSHPAALPC
jgi:class 3 adenylate cyclase